MNQTLTNKIILDLTYLHARTCNSSILTYKHGNKFITMKNPNSKHVKIIFELKTLET